MQRMIENLRIGPYAMRYSVFVPRLYNLCRSLGFERERMMPSRAFCSDESQGYMIIDRTGGPTKRLSTATVFRPSGAIKKCLPDAIWQDTPRPIGEKLTADLFWFRRPPAADIEGHDILEEALQPAMPALVTSVNPALDAARYHTQLEFDRTYRSILRADCYRNKNLLFISGVNIDISPRQGFPFPLIKFVPWAAHGSLRGGQGFVWEQDQVSEALRRQDAENPDRLSFDASIQRMADAEEIRFEFV